MFSSSTENFISTAPETAAVSAHSRFIISKGKSPLRGCLSPVL